MRSRASHDPPHHPLQVTTPEPGGAGLSVALFQSSLAYSGHARPRAVAVGVRLNEPTVPALLPPEPTAPRPWPLLPVPVAQVQPANLLLRRHPPTG